MDHALEETLYIPKIFSIIGVKHEDLSKTIKVEGSQCARSNSSHTKVCKRSQGELIVLYVTAVNTCNQLLTEYRQSS